MPEGQHDGGGTALGLLLEAVARPGIGIGHGKRQQLLGLVVAGSRHAARNPLALLRKELSVDEVMNAPKL